MLLHTAPVAVYPNSSLNAPRVAIRAVLRTWCRCHSVCSSRSFAKVEALFVEVVFSRAFGRRKRGDSFGSAGDIRFVSRPLHGVTLRAYPPPCGKLALLLPLRGPAGYGFHLRRTLRKCRASALGGGATRLASPSVTRAGYGKYNETEITTMYQNKAILMGFLGSDAEVRTGKNDQNFTTFSVATKTSYKSKETGEYISHTEWHRCIVFGKFSEFAATLKKGAHIQVG